MSDTHLDNLLRFETTADGVDAASVLVSELHGVEALSETYEFRFKFEYGVDGGLAPESIDGLLSASCRLGFGPGAMQSVFGVLRDIELMGIEDGGRSSVYEATLVPRLWLTTLTRRSRCFNEQSIPDILRTVFQEYGWAEGTDFEFRLVETYDPREYVVQHEESDFAFVSRWMERVGLYYFFDQSGETDKLCIADANTELVAVLDNPSCVATNLDNDDGAVSAIHELRRVDRRVPQKVHVQDYNWRMATRPVMGDADIDTTRGFGLQQHTGDHFSDNGAGDVVARLRAEAFNAGKQSFSGWTSNPDFAPGYRFSVSGAPVGELDIEYLLTRVEHESATVGGGSGTGGYRNRIQAIDYRVPYRKARVTPWPRISGIIHAKIDAESVSSAAPVDSKGRYRVVFMCDLFGSFGGSATRWVRKAEPYSGPAYGMHFSLHVGAEVAVAHVHGDPDRPVIVGSVPNSSMSTPLTSDHATRSAIRTRSGILIDFEDNA